MADDQPSDEGAAAGLPAGIDLPRHRDFEGRRLGQWLRHGFLLLLTAIVVAALLNVFGQRATTSAVGSPAASLTVTAPQRLRGGLLYQANFRIHALRAIAKPELVLSHGWFENTTVNTLQPEPVDESSDGDQLRLRYAPLAAGETLLVFLELQANPTNVGSHDASAAVTDGKLPLVSVDRTQFNFP
ncbi:MAG TPA: hypothetical protein VGC63_07690 [Solirubrobacterales bacterium]